ncbi:irregular chiasm C-roughest protein isoform X2 [Atheta coriaria]
MYQHKYEWAGPQQDTGDCSIWIRAAQLEFDDGNWECQVTASDFHTQDALTSLPVKLVVRVAPQRPRIEYNASQVLPGHNLTALHGEVGVIKCMSHYGNPPPVLKWFLDQNEITPTRRQSNSTELDNPRTWLAISILELTISKENNGKTLRCVAVHESYSTKSSSIEVRLDVMFVPETRLIGIPTTDIEELKDSVAIRCSVTANPKAAVVWKREGQTQPASLQEQLQFSPAVRQHAGLYTCHARNKAGESQPVRVHVDVKYAPKILSVGPDRLTTAVLFSSTTFECIAEGNPQPTYQWLQRIPSPSNRIVERGREAKLHISNVTYDYQGEYVCKVTNIIGGAERTIQSEAIALQVVGAPQVLRHSATPETVVEKGEDVEMSMVVCADPRPRVVAWEWGSLRLEAGSEMGRYSVDEVIQEEREDCYLATLKIKDAEATDSRAYYLAVENDRGTDRHAVKLYVNEPLQMSTLVTLAGASLAIFIVLLCMFIYTIKAEKCCFARKGDFKPSDLESEKLDLEKTATGPGGIPADAIYTTTPRGGRSPEAMKPTTTLTFNGRSSVCGGGGGGGDNVYAGIGGARRLTLPSPNACESDDDGVAETAVRGGSSGGGGYARKSRSYNKYNAIDAPRESRARASLPSGGGGRRHGRRTDANHVTARPKPLQADCEKYYEHIFPSRQPRARQSYNDVYYQPNSMDHAEL